MTYITCERKGCDILFDNKDHAQQRFCSKSCAKIGTHNRHLGAERSRPDGLLDTAIQAVKAGLSYGEASRLTGLHKSTIYLALNPITKGVRDGR